MTPPPALLLSFLVSTYLLARSRSLPALRPAAVACGVFVALDAARFVAALLRAAGRLPWWGEWADTVVVVGMPGVWGALLVVAWRREP